MLKGRSPILGVDARSPWAKGADLWYDFTKKANGITDTHADTIYAARADGLYLPYAANVLTRDSNGLQTVPTRTNLVLRSQEFDNAAWTTTATAVAANQIVAPDGTVTADKVTADGTSNTHQVSQSSITGTVATYTYSFYAKMGTNRYVQARLSALLGGSVAANFDLQAGVAAASATAPTSQSITALGNGWYLCSMTAPLLAASGAVAVYAVTSLSAISAEVNTLSGDWYLWQAQLELGAFASPPILTTTVAVQVIGNQPVISGLGTQLAVGVAGIVQVNILEPGSGSVAPLYISDGTASNRIRFRYDTGSFRMQVSNGGVEQAIITVGAWATGIQTVAFAVGTNFADARLVGQADPGADTSVTYPVLSSIGVGGAGFDANSNAYQFARKLALKFGPQNASTFDEWYKKALTA